MITMEQKETIIETIRIHGTMKAGAEAANISVRILNEEMHRSSIFRKRILEAREEGKRNVADNAIDRIKEYAFTPPAKTDRNVLTAAIALANAYEPGFRGTTTVQGKIDHDIRIITAVPRPKYEITIDKSPDKMLQSGKRTKKIRILDEEGHLIGMQEVVDD